MKKVALFLIVAGILTALYPLGHRLYFSYQQQRILREWQETLPAAADLPGDEDLAGEAGASSGTAERVAGDAGPEWQEEGTPAALLVIEKIDLQLPVFRGATPANLRRGAGLVEEGAVPGEEGNILITAHRSHNYGMQFNRLDELQVGDEILLLTREQTYRYIVFQGAIVSPADVPTGAGKEDERIVTLVTCHPLYSTNPPYRLVVQGRLAGAENRGS